MTVNLTGQAKRWLTRPAAWVLGVLIAALWNDWVLEPWLNPKVSMRYSLISELSARSQPYHWVFQQCDLAAGLLVFALLPFLARWLRKYLFEHGNLIVMFVALVGLGSITDASIPIGCAASVQGAACAAQPHQPLISGHLLESTVSVVALLVASILVWRAARQRDGLLAWASLGLVWLQTVIAVGVVVLMVMHVPWYGIPHRMYELGVGLWLAILFCSPLRDPARLASLTALSGQSGTLTAQPAFVETRTP